MFESAWLDVLFPFNLRYLQPSMLIIFWLLRSSRWSCLYFILFVLVGVYFVTNLILAVVYDSFKSEVNFSLPLLLIILTLTSDDDTVETLKDWIGIHFEWSTRILIVCHIPKQMIAVLKCSSVAACTTSFWDGSYEKSYVGESF